MQKSLEVFIAPAIPLVASYAASAAFSAAIGGSLVVGLGAAGFGFGNAIMLTQALSAGVGFGVSSLMSPKAKSQRSSGSGSSPQYPYVDNGVKINTRNTVEFRDIVYGQTRKGGTVVFEKLTSAGDNNLGDTQSGLNVYLHQIVVFATHQCNSFEKLFLNDVELEMDSDGWVENAEFTANSDTAPAKATTSYAGIGDGQTATGSGTTATIRVATAYATATGIMGAGDIITVAGISDTAYNGTFAIDSIATSNAGASTAITYTTTATITGTGLSQASLTCIISNINYIGLTAYVYCSGGHSIVAGDFVFVSEASPDLYNNDKTEVLATPSTRTFTYAITQAPTSVSISGQFQRRNGTDSALVNVQTFLGGAGQDIAADSEVASLMPQILASTDNFKGMCCAYVRYYNASAFNQQPQLTAELQGALVYDPRSGTLAYSNNAALVIMDYLHRKIGDNLDQPIGVGVNYDTAANTSTDIDLDNFGDAADICDETVDLQDGSASRRYTIDGVVSTGDQPIDVLSLIIPFI